MIQVLTVGSFAQTGQVQAAPKMKKQGTSCCVTQGMFTAFCRLKISIPHTQAAAM